MNENLPLAKKSETRSLKLIGGQRLVIEDDNQSSVLNLLSSNGNVSLSIIVTEDGPLLKFGCGDLVIQTEGSLAIDADRIALNGRSGMTLSTGGNLQIQAAGDFHSEARIQTISADLGNVNIRANDDVKCNGERILLNCL